MGIFNVLMRSTLGGGGRRIATGSLIGAGIGAATSDSNTSTGIFRDAFLGGITGAALGGLTTGAAKSALSGLATKSTNMLKRGVRSNLKAGQKKLSNLGLLSGLGSSLLGGAKLAARTTIGTASFIAGNPGVSAMAAGTVAGIYSLAKSGPSPLSSNTEDMFKTVSRSGIPSSGFGFGMGSSARQEDRAMFLNSTNGLVQGLHRGRH